MFTRSFGSIGCGYPLRAMRLRWAFGAGLYLGLAWLPWPVQAQPIPSAPLPAPTALSLSSKPVAPPLTSSLTLNQAFDLAFTANPDLAAARQELGINQADIRIAHEIPNPTAGTQYGVGTVTTLLANPQQVTVAGTVETAGKRGKRTLYARAVMEVTNERLRALWLQVRGQVRTAYANLVAAQAAINALDRQAALLDQLVGIAQKRFNAGAAPEAEVLQARLSRQQLDAVRNAANTRLLTARQQLNNLLAGRLPEGYSLADTGLFADTPGTSQLYESTVPDWDVDKLTAFAIEHRPDRSQVLKQEAANNRQIKLIRAQKIPDVQVSSGYLFLNTSSVGNNQRYYDGSYLGLGLVLPVFHNQGPELQRAKAVQNQTIAQQLALETQIRLQVQQAVNDLQLQSKNKALFESQLLPNARDVLSLAQESYRYGKTGLPSVILAEQTVQQIVFTYLDTINSYHQAWGNLEQAVGGELPTP